MKKYFIISTFLMLSCSLFATETISYRNILKQTSTKEAFVEKMKVVEQEIAKNNKSALMEFVKFHIGDATLVEFNYYNRVNGHDYYNIKGYNELAKKVGVKQEFSKAYDMLIKSAKSGNSDAMVMLGLLYHKGVGVKKNIDIAKEWWLSASKTKDLDARVIYAFYFETNIYEVVRNNFFLEHLVTDEKDMPRIFDPNKANIAPFVKEKKDEDGSYKEMSSLYIDDAKLISPACLDEFVGWLSDVGQGVYMLDPSQRNRFFCKGDIEIRDDVVMSVEKKTGCRKGYRQLAKFSNGLFLVEYFSDSGGSIGISSDIMLLGYEKVRQYGEKIYVIELLKYFGGVSLGYSSYSVRREIAVSGNVFGAHYMRVDMIWDDPKITNSDVFFISFETDKNKEKEDIDIILKKLKIAK